MADPVFKPGTTEFADGSPWTQVLAGTRNTSFKEASLKYGSVHYKVLPFMETDTAGRSPQLLRLMRIRFRLVLQMLRTLPASDYTKDSYYLFHKELDRIKAEMAKAWILTRKQLINEILRCPATASFVQNAADESPGSAFDGQRIGESLE